MTLREHLTECGFNMSRKEEQELRSIWPDATIMCNKMSHKEVPACCPAEVLITCHCCPAEVLIYMSLLNFDS